MLAIKPSSALGQDFDSEAVLYSQHPSMFRNSPIGYVACLLLAPVGGIGLLILLGWWLHCQGTTLTVTDRRTVMRTGILSKQLSDIRNVDVRSIQLGQTFFQRLLGWARWESPARARAASRSPSRASRPRAGQGPAEPISLSRRIALPRRVC